LKAVAELQIIPIGDGVSVRKEVARAVAILQGGQFLIETHASGTNVEGELADILDAVAHIHEILHKEGCARLVSYLKLETRTDKIPTLVGKRL
jgi:uncharacterized protein (TIGR00106 family)